MWIWNISEVAFQTWSPLIHFRNQGLTEMWVCAEYMAKYWWVRSTWLSTGGLHKQDTEAVEEELQVTYPACPWYPGSSRHPSSEGCDYGSTQMWSLYVALVQFYVSEHSVKGKGLGVFHRIPRVSVENFWYLHTNYQELLRYAQQSSGLRGVRRVWEVVSTWWAQEVTALEPEIIPLVLTHQEKQFLSFSSSKPIFFKIVSYLCTSHLLCSWRLPWISDLPPASTSPVLGWLS